MPDATHHMSGRRGKLSDSRIADASKDLVRGIDGGIKVEQVDGERAPGCRVKTPFAVRPRGKWMGEILSSKSPDCQHGI